MYALSTFLKHKSFYFFKVNDVSGDCYGNFESEAAGLLHHTMGQCQEVMSQLIDTLVTRQQQLSSKTLRSRQRENLKKLIEW